MFSGEFATLDRHDLFYFSVNTCDPLNQVAKLFFLDFAHLTTVEKL